MKTSMLKILIDAHKYLIFLIMFIIFVMGSAYWYEDSFPSWLMQMFMLGIIFFLVKTLPFHKKIAKIYMVWLFLAAVVKTIVFFELNQATQIIANAVMFVVYFMLIIHILRDIFLHKEVTQELIFASMCVYMLIGVDYANIYIQMNHHLPNAFDFGDIDVSDYFEKEFNIFYYSFTTLTTVGFGDIVPKHIAVKAVTILEQMTGVLYLAVLVSRLVSSFSTHHKN